MMKGSPAVAGTGQVHPAIEVNHRARMEILFAVLLGLFLSALDQTIVGPVLPRIVTDLRGADLYTWVVTAYLLTSTVTIPVYGKLSDLYGRRPLLMIGIVLFLIGSALSGLSQTMGQTLRSGPFRALAPGRCSRSPWPSSATSSPPPNEASTRDSSAPSSASRSWSARSWAGS